MYVHYNLRLRLKYIEKEVQLSYSDLTMSDFVDEDKDLMIEWVMSQQQESELDELGSLPRSISFIASEAGVDVSDEQVGTFHIDLQLICHSIYPCSLGS